MNELRNRSKMEAMKGWLQVFLLCHVVDNDKPLVKDSTFFHNFIELHCLVPLKLIAASSKSIVFTLLSF